MNNQLRTYFIKTYGCQMNYSDSERIVSVLEAAGLKPAKNTENADVIVFNTCSVRQSAEDRIFGLKRNMLKLKTNRDKKLPSTSYLSPITVLTGCMAKRSERFKVKGKRSDSKYLSTLKKKAPWVDIILPIQEINKLPMLLTIQPYSNITIPNGKNSSYLSVPPRFKSQYKASVPISTGCNEFCAYCIVPYARGELVNRPAKEIIDEVKCLVKKGYKDVMLLGQNVNAYNCRMRSPTASKSQETCNFLKFLKKIDSIKGNFWLTFLSSHPNYFTTSLIKYLAKSMNDSKYHICPYLNIALQSGSNRILKKMNRKYTVEKFIDICTKLKKKVPNLMLSTDIIVGFPGESEKDFKKTVEVMKKLEFDMAYINKYSPREGTMAARYKDNVSWQTKKRRAEILNGILRKTAMRNNKKYQGEKVTVLTDKIDKKKNVAFGKTYNFKDIKILLKKNQKLSVGEFFKVKVTKAKTWSLEGETA